MHRDMFKIQDGVAIVEKLNRVRFETFSLASVLSNLFGFSVIKYLLDAVACFRRDSSLVNVDCCSYILAHVLSESDDKFHFRRKNSSSCHISYENIACKDRSIVVKKINISY